MRAITRSAKTDGMVGEATCAITILWMSDSVGSLLRLWHHNDANGATANLTSIAHPTDGVLHRLILVCHRRHRENLKTVFDVDVSAENIVLNKLCYVNDYLYCRKRRTQSLFSSSRYRDERNGTQPGFIVTIRTIHFLFNRGILGANQIVFGKSNVLIT